jgi:hypothetical protein
MHEVGNDLGQQIAGFVIRPSHHPASCETYPTPRHATSSACSLLASRVNGPNKVGSYIKR